MEITDCDLQDIDLIIGQPMINQNNVSLFTTATSVNFIPTHDLSTELANIKLTEIDCISKFLVYLKTAVTIPKKTSLFLEVHVNCDDKRAHTFLTRPVCFEIGSMSYFIPKAVINLNKSHIKVYNLGNEDLVWTTDKIIARAELMTQQNSVWQADVFPISEFVLGDKCGIDISDVAMGDLNEVDRDKLLILLNKYSSSFAKSTNDLGCTDLIKNADMP